MQFVLAAAIAAVPVAVLLMRNAPPEIERARTPATAMEVVDAAPLPHVEARNAIAHANVSRRNLFAYVEAPPRAIVQSQPVARIETPAPIAVAPPPVFAEAPSAPRFPYRFIGRFGPDARPVAAFTLDGQVITARRGDRVGNFVVRTIGRESIDVESDGTIVRVALNP